MSYSEETTSKTTFSPTPILPITTSGTSAASLALTVQPSVTACSESLLQWSYNGPSDDTMTIGVYGARSDNPSSIIEKTIDIFNNMIVGQNSAFWTVDVAQGVYFAYASIPSVGLVANSSRFLVFNGTDTSCLNSPSILLSFSPLPSTTSTDSSIIPTSSSSTSSGATESASGIGRDQGIFARHSMSVGSIVGSAVGAFAALVAFMGFLYLLKRWRSPRGTGIVIQRWSGLNSDNYGSRWY